MSYIPLLRTVTAPPGATRIPALKGAGQAGCDLPAFAVTVQCARRESNPHLLTETGT